MKRSFWSCYIFVKNIVLEAHLVLRACAGKTKISLDQYSLAKLNTKTTIQHLSSFFFKQNMILWQILKVRKQPETTRLKSIFFFILVYLPIFKQIWYTFQCKWKSTMLFDIFDIYVFKDSIK